MIDWALANMAWASIVMALVLAVRRPVAAWFGAGSAYALWLLPAARLLMPPLPKMPAFVPELPALVPPVSEFPPMMLEPLRAATVGPPLPAVGGPGLWTLWSPRLLLLWTAGTILFILWQIVRHRAFLSQLRSGAQNRGTHAGLQLVESTAVDGPLALGLINRRIVVPRDFDWRYTAEERRLALAHETVHHRRGDIWWNHAALALLALNWFNPIAWASFRAFRTDQELACDARVTAAVTPASRENYARALVKSASRPGLIAACSLNHAGQLKRRLKMMKTHRSSRARSLGGAATVAALGGVMVLLGTPGVAQPAGPLNSPAHSGGHRTGNLNPARIVMEAVRRNDYGQMPAASPAPRTESWAGSWTYMVPGFVTEEGVTVLPQPVLLELNADGTGRVTTGQYPAMVLTRSWAEGSKVSFVMKLTPDCPATRWVGEVKAGHLRLVSRNAEAGGWFDLNPSNSKTPRLAADQTQPHDKSDAGLLYRLGAIYASGHGVPQDKDKALSLYRQAAEAGSAEAMLSLARAYDAGGLGLNYDDAEAANWFRRWAKASKDPEAAQMLASRNIQL